MFYGRAVYEDGTPAYPGSCRAWFKRDQASARGGEYFSERIEEDGSFRVSLSREDRKQLTENSRGMVEISPYDAPRAVVRVHIDKLSKDPSTPYEVVVPGKRTPKRDEKQRGAMTSERKRSAEDIANCRLGFALKPFELPGTDGRSYRLADYPGRPVLINVFTTWCGPCEEERPHLVQFHGRYAKSGLVVLAISRGEEAEVVEDFARRHRLPFPVLVDEAKVALEHSLPTNSKGQSGVPTNILIDRDHNVVYADVGFDQERLDRMRALVEEVLDQPGNPQGKTGGLRP